jgi:outer membrane protein TolC
MLTPPPQARRQIGSWDDALALIRSQSPDYATAYQSVIRAEAQKRIVLGAVLPVLSAQGGYTHQFLTATFTIPGFPPIVSPSKDLFTGTANFSWQAINPRGIYAVGTAGKNVEVSKLSFEDQRRQIALSIVHTMLATLAAGRVAEVNRVSLRAALGRLALTQSRQQFGQGTALDVDRGHQDVESSRRLIISGDESLLEAREALGASLGSPDSIAPPGDLDLDQFEAAIGRTCHLNDEIDRRPDVAAARGRVELAQRSVHDAELLFAPYLALSSQAQLSNQAVLGPKNTFDVGAFLTLPLYDGGVRYGALRDARAAFEQARQALVATRLSALVGSEQARRLVGVQQSAREVARRQVDDAERIDERTRSGYANGLGTSLDLVTSAQSLRQAQIDLAILDYQVAEARADAVLTNAECLY